MTGVVNKADFPRWDHQEQEFKQHCDDRSRMFIWPMRSGKSRGCIDVACRQFEAHKIEGAILIAPNGVHMNWARNEIPTWGWPTLEHRTFTWESSRMRQLMPEWHDFKRCDAMKWLCINMEALQRDDNKAALNKFIVSCHGKFILLISEAHHFGGVNVIRARRARRLARHADFVRIETGTPVLTGPLRAWSQFEILRPGALADSYDEFESEYALMVPMGKPGFRTRMKVEGYRNLPDLTRKMSKWTSLVMRADLHDMPDLIKTERPVVLSDKQHKVYLELVQEFMTEVEDTPVRVKDAGPRMQKLQQILGGYVIDSKTSQVLTIDANAPVYDATIDEIEGTLPGKSLVWCRFREDCRRLKAKLLARDMPVLEYWGDFTQAQREANRARYLDPNDHSTMIGTMDCGGEGLDFSAADAVIIHSVPPNALMVTQAQERATIKGGKPVAIVKVRHYGTVDDRMWEIVNGNIALADAVSGTGLRRMLEATAI